MRLHAAGRRPGGCRGATTAGFQAGPYLMRVDALERALRPIVAVFVDVALLREGAEGGEVGRVDLLAFFLEELERLPFPARRTA